VVAVVLLSFGFPRLYWIGVGLAVLLVMFSLAEILWSSRLSKKIELTREVTEHWSMGDEQYVKYHLKNENNVPVEVTVTDELPSQLQHRGHIFQGSLSANTEAAHKHSIKPTERGVHNFGKAHAFISIPWLMLVEIRKTCPISVETAVYPSFIQMKNVELKVFSKTATLAGIRRVREIGENDEFEQIRNYVVGDNLKSINWRATSRQGELMVNQYQNSKSQQVYCIIDKGRSMKMPFDDLTLLDYAINTTLVTSNIILRKYDKIGLVTFGNKIGNIISADAQKGQLQKITKALYNQKTEFLESNFELMYHTIRQRVRRRSILMLFTNFEHPDGMRRQLRYLKSLSKKHLLVVIFFTNAEIETAAQSKPSTVEELYFKTFAQEGIVDKQKIVAELKRNGIQVILSKPHDLSVNTINKYLEIKAKRMK